MKAYKVSYNKTANDGRVTMGTRPTEEYFINKEDADRVAEEKEKNWWFDMISVTEIEIK